MHYNFWIFLEFTIKIIKNKLIYVYEKLYDNEKNYILYRKNQIEFYITVTYFFWTLLVFSINCVLYYIPIKNYNLNYIKFSSIVLPIAFISYFRTDDNLIILFENFSVNINIKTNCIIKTIIYNTLYLWMICFLVFLPCIFINIILYGNKSIKIFILILSISFAYALILSLIRVVIKIFNIGSNTILKKSLYFLFCLFITYIFSEFSINIKNFIFSKYKILIINNLYKNILTNLFSYSYKITIFCISLCILVMLTLIFIEKRIKKITFKKRKYTFFTYKNINKYFYIFVNDMRKNNIIDDNFIFIYMILCIIKYFFSVNQLFNYNRIMIPLIMYLDLSFNMINTNLITYLKFLNVSNIKSSIINSMYIILKFIIIVNFFIILNEYNNWANFLNIIKVNIITIILIFTIMYMYIYIISKVSAYFQKEILNKLCKNIILFLMILFLGIFFLILGAIK